MTILNCETAKFELEINWKRVTQGAHSIRNWLARILTSLFIFIIELSKIQTENQVR